MLVYNNYQKIPQNERYFEVNSFSNCNTSNWKTQGGQMVKHCFIKIFTAKNSNDVESMERNQDDSYDLILVKSFN